MKHSEHVAAPLDEKQRAPTRLMVMNRLREWLSGGRTHQAPVDDDGAWRLYLAPHMHCVAVA
jgi:hypothetical protein